MKSLRKCLIADECGATAIEYALMASAIGAALAATVLSLGSKLKTNFYDAIAAMF